MKETILYCGELDNSDLLGFYSHPDLVKMAGYDDDQIHHVRVTEDDDNPNAKYYAWWDNEDEEFQFVAPGFDLVEICFHYGSKVEEERGRGKLMKVKVEEIS